MNNANDETSVQAEAIVEVRSLRARSEKKDYLHLLIQSLDTLIFFEIGILYCCDNITFLLAVRAISQVLYIQPKPPPLQQLTPQLAPTIVSNLVCLIVHIFHDRPEASARSARGWIHGGLLVDFVGELGPISKWRLFTYDILIAALQILMLIVGHERRKATGEDKVDSKSSQDIEAEEAGVRKSQEGNDDAAADETGIEMDRLLPSGSKEDLSSSSRREADDDGMIATIDVKQTLRDLTRRNTAAPQSASTSTDERADRMRAILGRLIADRVG